MFQHKKETGFTLLSLGVTLGVVAIFLSFTIPQAAATYNIYELDALQKELQTWANIAQQLVTQEYSSLHS